MAQRNDSPHEEHSTGDGAEGSASRDDGIRRIEAPRLVPAQDEGRELTADVVTVRFEDAARESGYSAAAGDQPAAAVYERTRRFIPLAAAVAIAAAVGAVTGALTTSALSRFSEGASVTATLRDDGRRLEETMMRIGRDLAALKANVDGSAKASATQMARLNERLEKTDKAQSEATAKVAKLADTLERNAADHAVTGSIPTAVPPVPALPAATPAQPPIVDGWVLRSVQNGTALIQGRIGLVEVEPGDSLPGLGRIETFRRQDGRWVVVTSRGLIVSR